MEHRRDIDGLRALAVMGVILDHAGVRLFAAGYAGVDVFFTISGFLIGAILLRDIEAGRFSLREFYARRARRIFPALYLMLIVTLVAGWFLLTPHGLRYLGGSAVATLAFVANIWFYEQVDYFNPDAGMEPLIHTWSLGVEEQFYIVVPLLLLLLARFAGRARLRMVALAVLPVLALASFGWAVASGAEAPQAAFYLPFSRAFELFLGMIAAFALPHIPQPASPLRSALVLAGATAIVASYMLIPETALWPGPTTLVPLAGTLLVLVFGVPSGAGARLLSVPPLAAVGLVSYSAYLWHQPLLSYLAISGHAPKGAGQIVAYVGAVLVLSALSWALVEQPFRTRRLPPRLGRGLLAVAALAIAAFAVAGHVSKGFPARMSPQVLAALEWQTSYSPTYRRCIGARTEGKMLDPAQGCVHGAEVPPSVAIWGDSHAAVLAGPLGEALAPAALSLRELTVGSCAPVLGLKNSALKNTEYCATHNRKMLDYLLNTPAIKVVVINGYWNSYTEARDFDTRAGWVITDRLVALPVDAKASLTEAERLTYMGDRLVEEVRALTQAGKQVVVLAPLPAAGFDPVQWRARQLWTRGQAPDTVGYPDAAFEDYSALSRQMLARLDLHDRFCTPGGQCDVIVDGAPLYFNDNHLSLAGVARVVPPLAALVTRLAQAQEPAE